MYDYQERGYERDSLGREVLERAWVGEAVILQSPSHERRTFTFNPCNQIVTLATLHNGKVPTYNEYNEIV